MATLLSEGETMKKTRFIFITLFILFAFVSVSCSDEPAHTESTYTGYDSPDTFYGAWVRDSESSGYTAREQCYLTEDGTYVYTTLTLDKNDDLVSYNTVRSEGTFNVYEGVDLLKGYTILILRGDYAGSLIYDNATGRMYDAGSGNENPAINYVQDATLTGKLADDVFSYVPNSETELERPKYLASLSDDQLNVDGTWVAVYDGRILEYICENGKCTINTMTLSDATTTGDTAENQSTKYEIEYLTYEEDGSYYILFKEKKTVDDVVTIDKAEGMKYEIFEYGSRRYISTSIGSAQVLLTKEEKSIYTDSMKNAVAGAYVLRDDSSEKLSLDVDGAYSVDGFKVAYTRSLLIDDEEGRYTTISTDLKKDDFWPIFKALYEKKASQLNMTAEEIRAEAYAEALKVRDEAIKSAEDAAEESTSRNELTYKLAQKYYNTEKSKSKLEAAKTNYTTVKASISKTKATAIAAANSSYEAAISTADSDYETNKNADDNRNGFGTDDDPYFIRAAYDLLYDDVIDSLSSARQGTITFQPENGFRKTYKYYSLVSADDEGENILKDLILVEEGTDVVEYDDLKWFTSSSTGESNIRFSL